MLTSTNQNNINGRIAAALDGLDYSGLGDTITAMDTLHWVNLGTTYRSITAVADELAPALITHSVEDYLLVMSAPVHEAFLQAYSDINYTSKMLSSANSGSALPDVTLFQLYHMFAADPDTTRLDALVLGLWDAELMLSLMLINSDLLKRDIYVEHLADIAAVAGLPTTDMTAVVAAGTDSYLVEFVKTYVDDVTEVPHFIAQHLLHRGKYGTYLNDGITEVPVDGTDYVRHSILRIAGE